MNPSIDEQIEAVTFVLRGGGIAQTTSPDPNLEAALATLNWVKRHAPTIKTLREQFPGSTFVERNDEG